MAAPPRNAAEFERLRTWATPIAETILSDVKWRDEGDERRFLGQGGLTINRRTGAWYSHSASKGGYSAIALIEFLNNCDRDTAIVWAAAWLASHAGVGPCDGNFDDDDESPASAAQARDILDRAIDVTGTDAEIHLKSRRIDVPYPDCVRFLRDARIGESALIGVLTASGRVVGVQLIYLDAHARKSLVEPKRPRFNLERVAGAVFEIPARGDSTDVLVAEGLADALSIYRYGKRSCKILGLPGLGTLKHLKFAKGVKVTVVCDGDAPNSPAARALQAGLDKLILDEVDVYVTATPPLDQDANSILVEAGVDGLVTFLDSAEPAILSLRGEIERMARLEELDYALVRKSEAKRLGLPVGVLDSEVRKRREAAAAAAAQAAQQAEPEWFHIDDTQPWETEVAGAELLDNLAETIRSFVIMTAEQSWCAALWVVFTHCFDVALNAPKLWIKSAEKRSGKTRVMELLGHLTARALRADAITAAMVPRIIELRRPTLLLDEFDTLIKDNEALRGVLNSGFDRDTFIIIGVKVGEDWVPRPFSPWCPQAIAGIGNLPDTIADRSFKIELERKARSTKVARLRRRDIGPVTELAQKAARWAADNLQALSTAEPEMPPELNDRAADGWELCIAIADLAGGHWPQRARQAARKISGDGVLAEDESVNVLLLSDVRNLFEQLNGTYPDKTKQALTSASIVHQLSEIEERPWPEFCRGQPLSQPQLARLLKAFHISPSTIRAGSGTTGTSKGYKRAQFESVWERYLPPLAPAPPPPDPFFSSSPSYPEEFADTQTQPQDFCGFEPDFEPTQGGGCVGSKTPGNPGVSAACVDVSAKSEVNEGYQGKNSEEAPKPNGSDPPPPPRRRAPTLGEVARIILAAVAEHPDWTPKRIAKHVGQTEARVNRVLANKPTNPNGAAP